MAVVLYYAVYGMVYTKDPLQLTEDIIQQWWQHFSCFAVQSLTICPMLV